MSISQDLATLQMSFFSFIKDLPPSAPSKISFQPLLSQSHKPLRASTTSAPTLCPFHILRFHSIPSPRKHYIPPRPQHTDNPPHATDERINHERRGIPQKHQGVSFCKREGEEFSKLEVECTKLLNQINAHPKKTTPPQLSQRDYLLSAQGNALGNSPRKQESCKDGLPSPKPQKTSSSIFHLKFSIQTQLTTSFCRFLRL